MELERDEGQTDGSMALELINTLADRSEPDPIAAPGMLEDWLVGVGIYASGAISLNISHVREARELRAAAFHCVSASITEEEMPAGEIDIINRLAAMPGFRPQLRSGRRVLEARNPRNAALSHLAADAIELLSRKRSHLRLCATCNRYFVRGLGVGTQEPRHTRDHCCPEVKPSS